MAAGEARCGSMKDGNGRGLAQRILRRVMGSDPLEASAVFVGLDEAGGLTPSLPSLRLRLIFTWLLATASIVRPVLTERDLDSSRSSIEPSLAYSSSALISSQFCLPPLSRPFI